MSFSKKIMVALAAASLFVLAGCAKSEDDPFDFKVSTIESTIDGVPFNHRAVAKVSNDAASGQDTKVLDIFKTNGTMVYTQDLSSGEKLIVTYAGKTAGTYNTGLASADTIATKLLDYLVTGAGSLSASDAVNVKSNVTYIDANGDKWFSTTCTVNVSGQTNGVTLSVINGTFACDVYKAGAAGVKKRVTGSIYNVVGIQ